MGLDLTRRLRVFAFSQIGSFIEVFVIVMHIKWVVVVQAAGTMALTKLFAS